jgi:hypothetical protein
MVFWIIMPCLKRAQRFGGTYRLDFHVWRVSEVHPAACFCRFLVWRSLRPWRWRRYVALKRRAPLELHDVATQKTAFFIVTTDRILNLASGNDSYLLTSFLALRFPGPLAPFMIGAHSSLPFAFRLHLFIFSSRNHSLHLPASSNCASTLSIKLFARIILTMPCHILCLNLDHFLTTHFNFRENIQQIKGCAKHYMQCWWA